MADEDPSRTSDQPTSPAGPTGDLAEQLADAVKFISSARRLGPVLTFVASAILAVQSSVRGQWGFALMTVLVGAAVTIWLVVQTTERKAVVRNQMPDLPGQPFGRDEKVTEILDWLRRGEASHLSVVGDRGVGTSMCASAAVKQWLTPNAPGSPIPDQQVYVDARSGHGTSHLKGVIAGLADGLGIDPRTIRAALGLESKAALVKNELSAQRMLLIIDNVENEQMVTELLPRVPDKYRLLTAGTVTATGGNEIRLDRLDEGSAVRLLQKSAELVVRHEQDEWVLRDLVACCDHAPGVIQAARKLIRAGSSTEELLNRLLTFSRAAVHRSGRSRRDARHLFGELAKADVAYTGLGWHARLLLRRLALAPPAAEGRQPALHSLPFDAIRAASGLRWLGEGTVRAALRNLTAEGFLSQPAEDRYQIKPMLVVLARIHLLRERPHWFAVRSEVHLLRHLAKQAERHASSRASGNQSWFRANHDLLRATVTACAPDEDHLLPRGARRWWFRLAEQLCVWYAAEDMPEEWRLTCYAVEKAPRRKRQTLPLAWVEAAWLHNELAAVEQRHGPVARTEPLWALRQQSKADRLSPAEKLGTAAEKLPWWQSTGRAQILTNQGLLLLSTGEVEAALGKLREAGWQRSRRDHVGRALTGLARGATLYRLAQMEPDMVGVADARSQVQDAIDGFKAAGELRGEAAALTNLGLVLWEMNARAGAEASFNQAEQCYALLTEETGRADETGRAALLLNRGAALLKVARTPDEVEPARRLLETSKALRQGRPTAGLARTLLYLGDAEQASARPDLVQAGDLWQEAKAIASAVNDQDCLRAVTDRGF